MVDLSAIADAFRLLSESWTPWSVVIPGLLIGLIAGAIPGVSNSMAMAVCLPLTLYMDFLPAVLFLSSIFTGGGYGGALTAVLMGIPGTSSAVATTFDGYPMARRGEHNEALAIALSASALATLFGYVVLFVLVEPISDWVLRLGPVEMFFIILWGLTMIATLSTDHPARGLMAGVFGLMLGTIGMNASGYMRGTMGISVLLDGVPVVPAMMGMFAASQLFQLIGTSYLVENRDLRRTDFGKMWKGLWLVFRYPVVLVRGSVIGVAIGALPGVGSSLSNLIAYSVAKRSDRDPTSFGKGNPKGVIASESANSSSEGGSMVTMLALGIPGGGGTAMLLAAFAMHNVTGGPSFIAQNKDIVYAIIFSNFVQAALLLVVGLVFIRFASGIVKIPLRILVPTVMVCAIIGSYAITGNSSGPITLFVFALLGWLMSKYDYPVAAAVVGLLLGRMAEGEFIRTYQISGGDPAFLLERPVALVIGCLLFGTLLLPALRQYVTARRKTSDMEAVVD